MAYVPRRHRKPYAGGAKPREAPKGTYLPSELHLVRVLAAKGASDAEIEQIANIQPGTLKKWRKAYPGLDKALEEGRASPDAEMLCALYKNGIGHKYKEEVAVGGRTPKVLTIERFKPGEFNAQKFWLTNRQSKNWKSRERVEHTGADGGSIGVKVEDRNTIIDQILGLVQPKPDPEPPKKEQRR